jgi:hypothetical protein
VLSRLRHAQHEMVLRCAGQSKHMCTTKSEGTCQIARKSALRSSDSTAHSSIRRSLSLVRRAALRQRATVASTAFSHDPEQRFLYVAGRSPARIWVLDRKTLEPLDSCGRPGVAPGEFYVLHHMNVDAKGNLYITEVQDGKRAQKFVFKGYAKAAGQ